MSAYTAVIVEPRKHPALSFVLQNVADNLSSEWKILVFHGKENSEYVRTIIEKMEEPSKFLTPIQLDIDNLSIEQYNTDESSILSLYSYRNTSYLSNGYHDS